MNASLFVLSIASLAAAPQDVIYDFYGTHCGYCQMMVPTIEKLKAEGYPIFPVNAEQYPEFAARYGVTSWPTFVLVVNGREKDRLVGYQDETMMRQLVSQLPQRRQAAPQVATTTAPRPRKQTPVKLVDDDSSSGKWNLHLPSFMGRKQNPAVVQVDPPSSDSSGSASAGSAAPSSATGTKSSTADDTASMKNAIADAGMPNNAAAAEETPRDDRSAGEQPAGDRSGDPHSFNNPEIAKLLASSVRIRVKDASGAYFGSGVVIDSRPGKSIVLTCGHILRDVKEGSRIEVDVFDGTRSRTYLGTSLKFDRESDLGLVTVATRGVIAVSPIASLDGGVRPRDSVVSIGCSQGELPSIKQIQVTMLNRYLGPDTIECSGIPEQGRSGGGLFTTRGTVVGICTNADPQYHRGVYAGLKPIHELLKTANLEDLIPSTARASRDSLAEAATLKTDVAKSDPAPQADVRPNSRRGQVDPDLEAPAPTRTPRASAKAEDVVATTEAEITPKMLENSEVICIIRPINQPKGQSRVVVINRASRRFMAYLTGEMKDQLLPAMGHTPAKAEPQAVTANDPTTPPTNPDPAEPPRTNATWKPTSFR
jgi:thiol-disulfide isomerase/thioredoxin